ncbi:lysophospholipid acyltransferase family protein [Streptomyces dysideae]|uniref:Acyltransferase n=1 Tax=Streptomyces dysideae TaxID=909626 RepID=A0A101UYN1_9ACTN|nr:lysophospholipid acyltransferase family protein [Streptomyces dysideae]KUO19314.1 acyltransferase [Streptomyces dysideae]
MLSRLAGVVVPVFGRLKVTTETGAAPPAGSIIIANHTFLSDPAVVLAALRRLGTEPVVLAAARLWRIPVLGRVLTWEGHIPVHRHDPRAAQALRDAQAALAAGRSVLLYPEGGLPHRKGVREAPPRPFHPGLFHLARSTGAHVVPLGQAGSRALASGSPLEQAARLLTAPLRRPRLHVHVGAPLYVGSEQTQALALARSALTRAWCAAARRLGAPVIPGAPCLPGSDGPDAAAG